MSDGPHRSLPMNKGWRTAAQQAEGSGFEPACVADQLFQGIANDFKSEVPVVVNELLQSLLKDGRQFLLGHVLDGHFTNAKDRAAGHSLAAQILRNVELELKMGASSNDAVRNGVSDALISRLGERLRQIEEHYLRHPRSSDSMTGNVRRRLELGAQSVLLTRLTNCVLGLDKLSNHPIAMHTGLDDGPPI
jgi:hypothetical protein